MTLLDVALIAVGAWLVLIIVTGVLNEARHRIDEQRRLGSSNWERRWSRNGSKLDHRRFSGRAGCDVHTEARPAARP